MGKTIVNVLCISVLISAVVAIWVAVNDKRNYIKGEEVCKEYADTTPFKYTYNKAGCFIDIPINDKDKIVVSRESHAEIVKDLVKLQMIMRNQ